MRVRYTPRAFADREAIFAYLDQRNPRAAREVKAYIKKRIADLGNLSRRAPVVLGLDVHACGLDGTRISSTTASAGRRAPLSTSGMLRDSNGQATDLGGAPHSPSQIPIYQPNSDG